MSFTPKQKGGQSVGIDRRLFCRSTIGSFADQQSARSPITESTIERTNTRLVGQLTHSHHSILSPAQERRRKVVIEAHPQENFLSALHTSAQHNTSSISHSTRHTEHDLVTLLK
jgi:hypothetical protein